MVKRNIFIVILYFVLLLQSCGVNPNCTETCKQLHSSYTHDGKQIEIEGYIYTDIVNVNEEDEMIRVKLHSCPFATVSNLLTSDIYLKTGDESNCISLPKTNNYKPNDIDFIDKNNNKFGVGSKVKLRGTVNYTNKTQNAGTPGDSVDYSYKIEDVSFEKY